MLRIGVLVSGGGTNLQAILDKMEQGGLPDCRIVTVVSSRRNAGALARAEKYHIPAVCISRRDFNTLEEYDQALASHMSGCEVDLVVMAGFLSILGTGFISCFRGRIINIHPALIPSFCGKGYYGLIPHQKALEYGVKVTGATVHFVDEETDAGPIIAQKAVDVLEEDTPEILQRRVMEQAEWKLLPEAIRLFAEGRLVIEGRKVKILPEKS